MNEESVVEVLLGLEEFGWAVKDTISDIREEYDTLVYDVQDLLDNSNRGRTFAKRLEMISEYIQRIQKESDRIWEMLLTEDEKELIKRHYARIDFGESTDQPKSGGSG